MTDPTNWTDLAAIIGRSATPPGAFGIPDAAWIAYLDAERTVSFAETPDGLAIQEGCDNYYGTTLTATELANLIAYLQNQLHRITR